MDIVDAMTWIRSRPQQFFGREQPEPIHLLAYVMADVVELGKGECVIRRSGEWWIVGSDVDWLEGAASSIVELFGRVVPAPAHGDHSMRGEVLLGAFATDIAVLGVSGSTRVKGREPDQATLARAADLWRAIVFRMSSAAAEPASAG